MSRDITIEQDQIDPGAPCQCTGCDWKGSISESEEVEDAVLTPSDSSPAGRCPDCDSLVYLVRDEDKARDAATELLAALQALLNTSALNEDELESADRAVRDDALALVTRVLA